MKNNQKQRILEYLKNGNSLTPLDALQLFGCFRLSGRIWDLKRDGYDIKSTIIKDENTGKYYSKYWICRDVEFEDEQSLLFGREKCY